MLIAPCTANFINKLANGHGVDILSLICLAFDKKIYVAPAMNPKMWENKITQDSINKLSNAGIEMLGTGYGTHACGEVGYGRMICLLYTSPSPRDWTISRMPSSA